MSEVAKFLEANPVQYLATVGRDGKQMQRPSSQISPATRPESTHSDLISHWIWQRFVAGGIYRKKGNPHRLFVFVGIC